MCVSQRNQTYSLLEINLVLILLLSNLWLIVMYPYITLAWLKIYMTGVGLVVWFIVFLWVIRYLSKRYRLSFNAFFYWLPISIWLIYLWGSYVYFLIDEPRLLFPTTRQEVSLLISPHGYRFQYIGVLIGAVLSTWIFTRQIRSHTEKILWYDVLFFGWVVALIPLWFFFVLGENFIGDFTQYSRGVSWLHPDVSTRLKKFNQEVIPLWLLLSIWSGLIFLLFWLFKIRKRKIWYGLLGFVVLIGYVSVLLIWQQYSRHLPLSFVLEGVKDSVPMLYRFFQKIDIKHYVSIIVMVILYRQYRRIQSYLAKERSSATHSS